MSDIFKLILSMSLSGSVLVLILLALRPLIKDRFSKAWQYYVWIIVLMRLLIPYSPEFGLVNGVFQENQVYGTSESGTVLSAEVAKESVNVSTIQNHSAAEAVVPAATQSLANVPDGWKMASMVWLAGALLLFIVSMFRYWRFAHTVHKGACPVASENILFVFGQAATELGMVSVPPIFTSTQIRSPMLMGLFRPAVFLPEKMQSLEEENLCYIFRHELTHFHRCDLWYKWLCELTLCIHWFNPLAYLISWQVNTMCELSCDEAVVKNLDMDAKKLYGNILLSAMLEKSRYSRSVLSTTLCENKRSLRERLISILNAGRKSKKVTVFSIVTMAVLCTVAIYLGAFSGGTQKNPAELESRPRIHWEQIQLLTTGKLGYQDIIKTYYYTDIGSGRYIFNFPIFDTQPKPFSLWITFDDLKREPTAIQLYNQTDNLIYDLNLENLNLMMKLRKGGESDVYSYSEEDETAIRTLVQNFGKRLNMVSLLGSAGDIDESMRKNYGDYVTPALLSKWLNHSKNAPGRTTLNSLPDRIDILSLMKNETDWYTVTGDIIEISDEEQSAKEISAKRPIEMDVRKLNGRWMIDGATLGENTQPSSIIYKNTQYGFRFSLPQSWKGYTVIMEKWQGWSTEESQNNAIIETGPKILIRHPKWTKTNPRQDIPIQVFTHEQWKSLKQEKFGIDAAPVAPSELGENTAYVFALPARYDTAALNGYEEVHEIIKNDPLFPD